MSRRGRILQISDVSKEALHYLKSRGFDDKLALRLYELVGGRIVHLESAADDIKIRNWTFDGMYGAYNFRAAHAVCYAENNADFSLQTYAGTC